MPKLSESIEIKATPKQCYEVISDYEKYPEYLSESKNVVINSKNGSSAEVTYTIEVIKKISYTLKMVGTPSKKISWKLIKGDLMKKNEGHWIFEEIKKGVTKAVYTLDIELGLFVPGIITKKLIGSNLPSMLKAQKERIEDIYGN